MTDKELIRKVQKGDKAVLNNIIERYYDDIYRLGKPNIFSVLLILVAMFFIYGYIGTLFTIQY